MSDASPPLYWSREYTDRLVAELRKDPAFLAAAKSFDDVIVLRCLDAPGGLDVQASYRIQKGTVELTRREEPAPSQALRSEPFDKSKQMARTTAPFSLWTKLDRGQMSVLGALASPEYAVEGSKLRIMANIGLLNAMNAVAARVPKRYT